MMPTNGFLECLECCIEHNWEDLSHVYSLLREARSMGSKEPHGRFEQGYIAW